MMKIRRSLNGLVISGLAIVSLSVALAGCVHMGNTHALVTPLGAVGYHTFRPDNAPNPNIQRDMRLQGPDRVAAANEQKEPSASSGSGGT